MRKGTRFTIQVSSVLSEDSSSCKFHCQLIGELHRQACEVLAKAVVQLAQYAFALHPERIGWRKLAQEVRSVT